MQDFFVESTDQIFNQLLNDIGLLVNNQVRTRKINEVIARICGKINGSNRG
jgi:hypothetical protein